MTKPTVYVVDDDQSIRQAIARLLKTENLSVVTFESAQDFLDYEHIEGPSCLVLDIRMPGIDGLELQKRLNRKGLTIPVIFITGHGTVQQSVIAMKAGAIDFIEKPFGIERLLSSVKNALELDNQRNRKREEEDELQARLDTLTRREHDVLALVLKGMLNKQIGHELGISEKTVKIHRGRVMQKCQASTVAELVFTYNKLVSNNG